MERSALLGATDTFPLDVLVCHRKQTVRAIIGQQAATQNVPADKGMDALCGEKFCHQYGNRVVDKGRLIAGRIDRQANVVGISRNGLRSSSRRVDHGCSGWGEAKLVQHEWINACIAGPGVH